MKKGFSIEEPEDGIADGENEDMKSFSLKVATAHTYIKDILLCVDRLKDIKESIGTTVGTDKERALSKDIDDNVSYVQLNQQKMKIILEQLQESVKEAKDLDKDNSNPETRIKSNLFGSLLKQYETACSKFQTTESDIKTIMQTRVIRDAEIIMARKLEPAEKEQVLLDPGLVQKFYEDKLTTGAHIKLQNAVSDLEERHKDLQKLERVNYLLFLNNDLSTLIVYKSSTSTVS